MISLKETPVGEASVNIVGLNETPRERTSVGPYRSKDGLNNAQKNSK